MKRVLYSKTFYYSIIGLVAINILNLMDEMQITGAFSGKVPVFYFFVYRHGLGGISILGTVFAVLPFALSYSEEYETGYFKSAYLRCGSLKYAWSKVITNMISAFLVFFLGYLLLIALLCSIMPLFWDFSTQEIERMYVGRTYFISLAANKSFFFFLLQILHESTSASFLASSTLLFSLLVKNKYLLLCFPVIMIKAWEALVGLLGLPEFMKWTSFYNRRLLEASSLEWVNYCLTLAYFIMLSIIAGLIFVWRIGKEAENV